MCIGSAAITGLQARYAELSHAGELQQFSKALLVDGLGHPVKGKLISTIQAYVFNYPFAGTPCFLINLGHQAEKGVSLSTERQQQYTWLGGVGLGESIVAYSAICAHQLAYPSKETSPITYSSGKSEVAGRSGVIVCCAHNSVYDPSLGAKVLSGPATQPLASIQLEYDQENDELYATGVYGGALFENFFKAYRQELATEYVPGAAKEEITKTTTVKSLSEYTQYQIKC